MKKSFMVLLCVVLCMFAFSAGICAADVTSGTSGDTNWNYDAATKTLTFALQDGVTTGKMGDYKKTPTIYKPQWSSCSYVADIQKVVIGDGITHIGNYAFLECSGLKEIQIPDSVTTIGTYVFYDCSSLEAFTIPKTIDNIPQGMFYGCKSLKSIEIPANIKTVNACAFQLCTGLTVMVVPDTVTTIGTSVFQSCSNLKSIELSSSLTAFPNSLFYECKSLESLIIPANVTSIGQKVFWGCTALKKMEIPDTVETIKDYAFSGCTGLTELKLPLGLTTIPGYMIDGCMNLSSLVLPASVTTINNRAFTNSGLTTMELPSKLTSVPDSVFFGCTNLKKITIPEGVTEIKSAAFQDCKSLTEIKIPQGVKTIGSSAFAGCEKLGDIGKLPEGVTLKGAVFKDCKSLTSVEVPASVKINSRLFMGCSALKEATVCFNGTCDNMFSGCTSLEKVTLLDGSTGFGKNTFNSYSDSKGSYDPCTKLKEIVIPASLASWGTTPFDLEALKNIKFTGAGADNFPVIDNVRYTKDKATILVVYPEFSGAFEVPASVTAINNNCFSGCTGLTEVTFAEGSEIESIGSNVFYGCTALAKITLPASLKSIGSGAFAECSSLGAITLPEGLESIGREAFLNCAKLKELKLPDGITTFGYQAVQGTGIEEMIIPASVTTLEKEHFSGNKTIKRIVLEGGVTNLPPRAFAHCTNIESITLPDCITSIEDYSLQGVPLVYFKGTAAQWGKAYTHASLNSRYQGTVILNYKEPTTEKGKMEVAEYPQNLVCSNREELENATLPLKLKYPDGVEPQEGDNIWVNWYYTTKTPDGINNLNVCNSSFDRETLTTSPVFTVQAINKGVCTWHYLCVVFKTDAQGETTMFVSDPISVTKKDDSFVLDGNGSEKDPFLIKTLDDLKFLEAQVEESGNSFEDVWFALDNDEITIPKDGWDGISGFGGIFDGKNHVLYHEKGAVSLFDTIGAATIQNLKIQGEYIASSGLAYGLKDPVANVALTVKNCTLVSGTVTKGCGFVRFLGNGSFTDCTVEEGCKVGWDVEANEPVNDGSVGSIIGGGAYKLTNCKSAATVYGKDSVGGLGGRKGYSMRGVSAYNCQFTGEIIATGQYVGGIISCGYDDHTAPNSPCVSIENCYVNAKITGLRAVGGIFGGESGVDQCWGNGIGYIRNNLFYGTVTATEKTGIVPLKMNNATANLTGSCGGIVGFMRSLNKYNVIENNFYYDTNGCNKAIGAVEHIDTSAREFGMGDDGIFYYDTTYLDENFDKIKEFVDGEDIGSGDYEQYTSVCNKNFNRTDDPMGKDAAKLGRNCTVEEMKDGTVLKLLNSSASSMKNWIMPEGAVCPMPSNDPIVTELTLSGEYKTEYYIGEQLDMTGAVFTAIWSNGKTEDVSVDEITFTGFDSSQRVVQTVTAAYRNAKVTFEVKIVKNTAVTFEVSFTLLGDSKHGDLGEGEDGHTLAHENLTTWLETKTYTVAENATVWDLLQKVSKENGNVTFHTKAGNSNYVSHVTFNGETLGEFDNGTNSGWMYILNGRHPLLGVQEQFLEPGDEIVWHYTDNYTIEDPADDARVAVMETVKLIDAIGEVTKDSKAAIDAARAAYDALTEEQQSHVSNYDKLLAAEKAYADLDKEPVAPVEPGVEVIDPADLPFTDLNENWYKEAIAYVYSYDLMKGMSGTTFEPQTTLTRAMMATILYRIEGEPAVTGNNAFSDVKNDVDGAWYYNAVLWATQNGIVEGYEDGTFRPVREITREEMATMMYRYAEYKGMDMSSTADFGKFSDGATVSAWAKPYMSWGVGVNLITGHDNGTLEPQGTATRAQAATVLMRFNEMVK